MPAECNWLETDHFAVRCRQDASCAIDPDPANNGKITDWARGYYNALHPFGAGWAYLNFMMEEGEDRIRAAYRGNYERLAAIKTKYDPTNFFRVNQNIRPAA